MRAYVRFNKLLFLSPIRARAYAAESPHRQKLCLPSSEIGHSENDGTFITHDRQTQRKYLGKLLLSPPQEISNLAVHWKIVHAQIILSGFESNIFLNNILITGYSRYGSLGNAVSLFDRMPKRNLISWSSVISAYRQRGYNAEALLLFGECMKSCNENPNELVLATVIQSCTELSSLEIGRHLHGFVIKAGYSRNAHVGTSLIDFYAKSGDLDAASLLFDGLEDKNVVTWTAIIMGFGVIGRSDVSLDLFKEMVCTNVVPDKHALSSVLGACSMLEFLEGGKQVHAYVLRTGANIDISVSNLLIQFYAKCGEPGVGHKLFNQMLVKNYVSWTMMICGYMQNGFHLKALSLFKNMTRLELKPDQFSCASVLVSCGFIGELNQGKQLHTYTVKVNLDSDEFVTNSLIDMYCKCNSLNDARKVFHAAAKSTSICYNAMMDGYTRKGSLYDALDLFNKMRQNLTPPSLLTFVSLLGVSTSHVSMELIRQLHSLMIKYGFFVESFGGSALIDAYSKFLFIGDARLVFEEITEKDIVVWNSMLFGYAIQSKNEETLRLYSELLLHSRERPNSSSFVAIIMASSNLASLSHGLQFHNQTVKMGLDSDPFVANALMDMYAKCGSINAAETLFNCVPDRDIACWNSIISTHAQHGDIKNALRMFEQMQDEGIKPDHVTFVAVLSACAHVGQVEKGFHYFDSMSEFGLQPGTEHYACMVSLLGRAGKLHEAKSFIENMPIQPTVTVWNSLLSACRVGGDLELGQEAAEMAISSDPQNSGSYVLLSNIFASKSMWSDVNKLRAVMEKNDVVKETGHSWIEINGEVHLFVARDRSHRQARFIYSLLDQLIQHMRMISYEAKYAAFASVC